jgi:type II secretory pathway component PulF
MSDLKIPNLNMNSNKYIFKKKLSLRRKSKKRLFSESAFMFILSLFLVYINYLIPNKDFLFQNLPNNLKKIYVLIVDFFSNLSEILIIVFIIISYFIAFILLVGSLYRLVRITKRKTKTINYK